MHRLLYDGPNHWHRNRVSDLFSDLAIDSYDIESFRETLQAQLLTRRQASFSVNQKVIVRSTRA